MSHVNTYHINGHAMRDDFPNQYLNWEDTKALTPRDTDPSPGGFYALWVTLHLGNNNVKRLVVRQGLSRDEAQRIYSDMVPKLPRTQWERGE